jgi:hypothetical protein
MQHFGHRAARMPRTSPTVKAPKEYRIEHPRTPTISVPAPSGWFPASHGALRSEVCSSIALRANWGQGRKLFTTSERTTNPMTENQSDEPDTQPETETHPHPPTAIGRLELSDVRVELNLERACAETFKPCHIFPPDALALALQGKLLPAPKVRP